MLTSVIVPLLVSAAKRSRGRSDEYDQRMFTAVTGLLFIITLIAMLLAGPIARIYDPIQIDHSSALAFRTTSNELHLLVLFAYFFIPQIFFYGVSSLAGAILNARNHSPHRPGHQSSTTSW